MIMEQCTPIRWDWDYYNEDEGMMGDIQQYVAQSRMELEATFLATQEEIMKKQEELQYISDLLFLTIKERDEASSNFHKLVLEKSLLQQQLEKHQQEQKLANVACLSNITDITTRCIPSSPSSESEDRIIMSSPQQQPPSLPPHTMAKLSRKPRALPEKGKLLKAVVEAGPLLQTLLLAGPLPEWQHPPPQLDSIEIPSLTLNTAPAATTVTTITPRKRGIDNLSYSMFSSPKYLRVA